MFDKVADVAAEQPKTAEEAPQKGAAKDAKPQDDDLPEEEIPDFLKGEDVDVVD